MEWRAERRRNGWIRCDRDRQREGETGKVRQRDGHRAQKLCESRGSRPGIPAPNSPYGLFGRKVALKNRAQKLCESRGGRPGIPAPNGPYGL